MVIMKTKNKNSHHKKPFHLHVEHFFRMPALLLAVVGMLMIVIIKADSKTMAMMREAYAHGYGLVGSYMREETVRAPVTFAPRINTISGK